MAPARSLYGEQWDLRDGGAMRSTSEHAEHCERIYPNESRPDELDKPHTEHEEQLKLSSRVRVASVETRE